MVRIATIIFLLSATAVAQEPPAGYAPPDEQLWQQMIQAIGNISMPLTAHQQVQQIMQSVEGEAKARAAKAKAPKPK